MPFTDVHVHLAAMPTVENGCRLSEKMSRSFLLRFIARRQGIPLADADAANQEYINNLDRELSQSESVKQAVVLAMDGVYDSAGKLDERRTAFLVSNHYLFQVTAKYPRFLPGASINPQRRDALNELDQCAERGAALVKVLPNAQGFDPADSRFIPFYKALARYGIPLLSHVGFEFTLSAHNQGLGDPLRLVPALEQGVTVIAAHGCSSGLFVAGNSFKAMLRLATRYKNFFVDTSALTLPNRVGALFKLRQYPEIFDRLVFGTDYPLPCLSYPCLGNFGIGAYLQGRSLTNRFDRQLHVLKMLGVSVKTDAAGLLRMKPPTDVR